MLMLKSNDGKTGTVLIDQKQQQKRAQKTRVRKPAQGKKGFMGLLEYKAVVHWAANIPSIFFEEVATELPMKLFNSEV